MEEWSLATKSPRAPLFSKVPDLWCTPLMESAQRSQARGAVRSAERVRMLGPVRDEGVNLELGRRAEHLSLSHSGATHGVFAQVSHLRPALGDPVRSWVSLRRANRSDSGAEPPP